MIVVFTRTAERDLEAIGDYIAASDSKRAARFVDALVDRCNLIAEHLLAFALHPGFVARGVRRRRYAKYLIFYRIASLQIEILRVVHSARDYDKLLS